MLNLNHICQQHHGIAFQSKVERVGQLKASLLMFSKKMVLDSVQKLKLNLSFIVENYFEILLVHLPVPMS